MWLGGRRAAQEPGGPCGGDCATLPAGQTAALALPSSQLCPCGQAGRGGTWGPSLESHRSCGPWPGPGEMHYINVNFPPSRAHSFNKLSARGCQPNFSHFVSLFSVWGNPASLGRGGLAAGKVQLCVRRQGHPTGPPWRGRAGPALGPGLGMGAWGAALGRRWLLPSRFPGGWALGRGVRRGRKGGSLVRETGLGLGRAKRRSGRRSWGEAGFFGTRGLRGDPSPET